MRKLVFLLILLTTILLSCRNKVENSADERLISVSILPQKAMVEAIAGEKFRVNVLIPEEGNHETYEPTARQLMETEKSEIYFQTGHLGFEKAWLPGIIKSQPKLKLIDTSEGIDLIMSESHNHGDHIHHGGVDPHTWLSVSTVKIQAGHILEGLLAADPDNSAYYEENFHNYIASLDSMDNQIKDMLEPLSSRTFMIFHPSLGYFARDYNLEQIAIEFEGKEPGPAYLKQMIDLARERSIQTILVSSQFSEQSAQTIAGQINVRIETFNPTAEKWEETILRVTQLLANQEAKEK